MNKKIILILILVLLTLGIGSYFFPTSIQITQIYANTSHRVSEADLTVAEELFSENNIKIDTLTIYEVLKDGLGKTHIKAEQSYKGLPIFFNDIIYHFDQSGKAQDRTIIDGTKDIFTSGDRIKNLNISTKPNISMAAAVRKAREKIKSNYFFTAELGILDLNTGTSYSKPNFVLIWRVKPKGADNYPYTDIDANSGKLLRYDDGIRYQHGQI